ncbi:hypothetical protein, partial [Klebsiella pneumoniae]
FQNCKISAVYYRDRIILRLVSRALNLPRGVFLRLGLIQNRRADPEIAIRDDSHDHLVADASPR